ncbi:Inosine-5'-monophosphate dehydrogenase [Anaerolineae bacterium]|nr:Inosine-5'-monophosphate dehydrogenase [Anaerolineae bacterium]
MLVRERMTPNPVTITPDTSVSDAMHIMRERRIRRLPILDAHDHLVGIVTDSDLLYATPSPVTSLSVWEIHDLLYKLKVEKVMTHEVVTVTEDMPLEQAARILADNRISGLPVMRDKKVVGIITETDIFKAFLALLGGRRRGVRITVAIPSAKGTMAKITGAIFGAGGDIVGLGLGEPPTATETQWHATFKVQDVPKDKLVAAIRPVVDEILDVRET